MNGKVEARLASLGLALPAAPNPVANYVPSVLIGDLLYISGQISKGGRRHARQGAARRRPDVEQGQAAARLCALNILAQAKAAVGDLDRIAQVVKLTGFVNAAPEFVDHPQVVNGASDLMVEVLGDDGRHTRAAVGVSGLPLGCSRRGRRDPADRALTHAKCRGLPEADRAPRPARCRKGPHREHRGGIPGRDCQGLRHRVRRAARRRRHADGLSRLARSSASSRARARWRARRRGAQATALSWRTDAHDRSRRSLAARRRPRAAARRDQERMGSARLGLPEDRRRSRRRLPRADRPHVVRSGRHRGDKGTRARSAARDRVGSLRGRRLVARSPRAGARLPLEPLA